MVRRVKKKMMKTTTRKSVATKRKKTPSKKVTTKRSPAKKPAPKKAPSKKKSASKRPGAISNQKSQWAAYKNLQHRIHLAWDILQKDIKKNAPEEVLIAHKNHLLLLLGECNYMARECMNLFKETENKAYTTPLLTDQHLNPLKNRF